jgi:tetratricopeptide (TPR) repeat protein
MTQIRAALAHAELFELTGDPTHLDDQIAHLRELPGRDAQELLIEALVNRQEARPDQGLDDIDEAVRLQREIVATTQEPVALAQLGLLIAQRFRTSPPGDPDELTQLDEAIALLSEAQHTIPFDDPDRSPVVASLGDLYVTSHLAPRMTPDKPRTRDLDHGIDLLRSVADHNAAAADRLATALGRRYLDQEHPVDRDEALAILERLGAEFPGYLDECAVDFSSLYVAKLEESPTRENFDRAVDCLERALRQQEPDTEYLRVVLVESYLLYWGRVPSEQLDHLHALSVEMGRDDPSWSDMSVLIEADRALSSGDHAQIRHCSRKVADKMLGPYYEDKEVGSLAAILAALLSQLHGAEEPWPDWSPFALWAKASVERVTELLHWLQRHRSQVPRDSPDYGLWAASVALLSARLPVPQEDTVAELENALAVLPGDHPAIAMLEYELGRRAAPPGTADPRAHVERALALLSDAATRFSKDDPTRARCLIVMGMTLFSAYTQGFAQQAEIERIEELIAGTLGEVDDEPESTAVQMMALGLVRGMRWLVDPAGGDMRGGLTLQSRAASLLPDDHPVRLDIRYCTSILLMGRSQLTRNIDDMAMAEAHLRAILPVIESGEHDGIATADDVAAMLRTVRLHRLVYEDKGTEADVAELDEIIDTLATTPGSSQGEDRLLMTARFIRAHRRGDTHEAVALFSRIEDGAEELPEHLPFATTVRSIGTMAAAGKAVVADDRQGFEEHVAIITALLQSPDISQEERARFLFIAGGMSFAAYTKWGEPHRLDSAIALLEECLGLEVATAEPFGLYAAEQLSTLYWKRGEPEHAIDRGFTALREYARQVLRHQEIAHGASKASTMADTAHALALRCVAAGRPEQAVAAIEGGRGLAMHAATSDVGTALRELGHEGLALEWEHSRRMRHDRPEHFEVPTDLHHRVVALLAGTEAERRLLSAPTTADIARALQQTGADALVYLVPAAAELPGAAPYVTSAGQTGVVPLPVTGGEVDRYIQAYRAATSDGDAYAVRRWRAELGELVRWAWVVIGPVLAALGDDPHVVLVPCGSLGVVPWHAACDDSTGRTRYAISRATFSYVASARQFCDVAARPRRDPADYPVVVADPTGDLFGSTQEARYLYEHRYPDGEFYGVLPAGVPQDGVGDPDDLLQLRDVSLLHLSCHAKTGTSPAESYVELTEKLTVTQVLRHARDGIAPGGLVVLAACVSDLADREHDEALTLATAFLAAGAASVVGTRWAVDDRRSAVVMCLFHRYLDELPPAQALRAAQLWALDPDRELPADIAEVLGTTRPDIPLTTWAAFNHQGA